MLTALRIKNLALVADLTLELQPGFNVITGETGAGKSIIIGALNLVLGERADRTLIRSGADSCSVEAVLDVGQLQAPLAPFLEENGLEPCEDGQLVLKRTFSAAGTNRQFVNGSPTTLATLGTLGQWLVDMHGPHDHQSLLHPPKQLAILDAFGDLAQARSAFAALLHRRQQIESDKATLIIDEKTYAQQLDLLRFQSGEIAAARLKPDEEAEVEQEYQRASNAAKLLELSQGALNLMGEDDPNLLSAAGAVGRNLSELQRIDATTANLLALHGQAVEVLRDLQNELSHYVDRIDLNPERLQELTERLDLIHSLKRKYGSSLTEVIAFGDDCRRKLENLEQRDAELTRLNTELDQISRDLAASGKELSRQRRKVIPKLTGAAMKHLADLGFKQSQFDISITINHDAATASGMDEIEFQFAPNVGEPARPLRAIASSGEIARVMLALKTALAAEDEIPVLIFDEVDANVGGETAQAVGEKMQQIAARHQVLCITHLPAVAAAATSHYVVTKQVKDGRTISEITLLEKKERIVELARMLGGQTEAARRHAVELLKTA